MIFLKIYLDSGNWSINSFAIEKSKRKINLIKEKAISLNLVPTEKNPSIKIFIKIFKDFLVFIFCAIIGKILIGLFKNSQH